MSYTIEKSLFKLNVDESEVLDAEVIDEHPDDLEEIEFEIIAECTDEKINEIQNEIAKIDGEIDVLEQKLGGLNAEIDRLTNHADGLDYMVAVASGIITGLIDSFFVGELGLFDNASDSAKEKFKNEKAKSNEKVNKFIEKYAKGKAKLKGKEAKVTDLKSAIQYLQDTYPVDQDNTWKGEGISSASTHHLDDLAHHPTLLGLISAIMVQFFRISLFASKDGKLHPKFVKTELKDLSCWVPVIISGILKWLTNVAEKNDLVNFDDDVPKPIQSIIKNLHKAPAVISILRVADNWFGHLVSDMAGSKQTAGGGMGIPGVFMSLLKEISMLPVLKNTDLPRIVNDLYASKQYTTEKIDLRTELAVFNQQALPVVLNELIVRTFYFVRRLINELKEKDGLTAVDWKKVIPFKNRTVVRMLTIATGTFTAVDLADAAIRSGGFNPNCLLRINFVGIGRFVVALGTDIGMGIKRSKLRNERLEVMGQQLFLLNAKVYYKCAEMKCVESRMFESQGAMWIEAETTVKTLMEACKETEESMLYCKECIVEIYDNVEKIGQYKDSVDKLNPRLTTDLSNILRWGEK